MTAAEIHAAILVERCIWEHGTCLFVDTDGILKVLDKRRITPHLERLAKKHYDALIWLLRARAA